MRILTTALLVMVPALALAEPTFVPGGRVGMELPPGFAPSTRFSGFENPAARAGFIVGEMPREAWPQLRGSFTDTALRSQGITVKERETPTVADSEAILIRGEQSDGTLTVQKWILVVGYTTATALVTFQAPLDSEVPQEQIRKALLSLEIRAPLSLGEQLSALPFTLGETPGFRVDRVVGGNSALLVPTEATQGTEPTVLVVVAGAGGPVPPPDQRDAFAQGAVRSVPAIRGLEVDRSEAVQIGGDPGHEIVGHGQDARNGRAVSLVQWMRFRDDGYVRTIAILPTDQRETLMPQLQAIRDAVAPKP